MADERVECAKMIDNATLTMVVTGEHPSKCGTCTLCCKLLPMKADHWTADHMLEVIDRMIAAGWANTSDFTGMMREWSKPAGKPCQHQRHGKGCAVYATRPFCCRTWSCRWLTGDDTAELSRPDRSRVVIDIMPDFVTFAPDDGSEPTNLEIVQIWVDPATPDAWRDPTVLAYIERRAAEGKAALIRFDSKRAFAVFAPPLCNDGQWHEHHGGEVRPDHLGDELIEGLATARKVKFAVE